MGTHGKMKEIPMKKEPYFAIEIRQKSRIFAYEPLWT